MSSFKLKLFVYFVVLALLPVAAAFWGFSSVTGEKETHQADTHLQTGLGVAVASLQERLDAAQAAAQHLAENRSLQIALERGNEHSLAQIVRATPHAYVTGRAGLNAGPKPGFAARRTALVVTRKGIDGVVGVFVPLDRPLAASLARRAGVGAGDALALIAGSRVVVSSPASVHGTITVPPGGATTVRVGGTRYRLRVAPAVAGAPSARLALLIPQSRIDGAIASDRTRILLGLLACLLLVAAVAFLEGRAIVRSLRALADAAHGIARGRLTERVPVRGRDELAQLGSAFNDMAAQLETRLAELEAERGRARHAADRFSETLAVTHDADELLRVIAEGAVEATGASGARLSTSGGAVVESGNLDAGPERLELPLVASGETLGRLELAGSGFRKEQLMSAASLVSHAAVALENVRLHRLIERQALVDALTGIANRRACEEGLQAEIGRADRLATPLTIVVGDLDNFKLVNDRHGHAVGDRMLQLFAAVLRENIRASDTAGRWGGEEFMLLLPGSDAEGAVRLAHRIRGALGERSVAGGDGGPVIVTCSFGVAQHVPGGDADAIFAAADRALYRAKREGKDRVELEPVVRSFS
jgi:two-component system cell cycle response regulator